MKPHLTGEQTMAIVRHERAHLGHMGRILQSSIDLDDPPEVQT